MSKIKSKLATYALGALVLAVGVPIYMGVQYKLASPAGAACSTSTKCRGNSMFSLTNGMCFEEGAGSYCTHECASADDCTAGMACEEVDGTWTTETTQGNHATQTRTS